MNFVEYITELMGDAGRLTGFLDSPDKDMAEHGFGDKTLADAREAMALARQGGDDDAAFRRLDAGFARAFGVVAGNDADLANISGGTANVATGPVNVRGATGPNVIDQSQDIGRGGINTGDQVGIIDNDTNVRANTGGNTAIGNASRNVNALDQDAVALGGRGGRGGPVASNQADLTNISGGTANIQTGAVNVAGASGPNVIDQSQNIGRGGINTGDQVGIIDNDTNVSANTGGNTAIGNASRNVNALDQDAVALGGRGGRGGPVASNQADLTNMSGGTANVTTGAVNVAGASGPNVIDQSRNIGAGGINTGDQAALIDNDTNVRANTGGNTAIGNASRNVNALDQDAVALGGRGGGGPVASNQADLTNASTGSANITTGAVNVAGASGPNVIDQSQNIGRGGINTGDQVARIDNDTNVSANTGGNTAIGNASRNVNALDQDAVALGGRGGGGPVASNQADLTNASTGSANITTGAVNVSGASGPNVIDQSQNIGRGGINTGDQVARIDNDTNVRANTGGNTAVGNASRNVNALDQDSVALGNRAAPAAAAAGLAYQADELDDDGGRPTALYNQVAGDEGPVAVDPNAHVDNQGDAQANTGGNPPESSHLLGAGGAGTLGGMHPADAPFDPDDSVTGSLPGGPHTPLWDPGMGTTPTPPVDPAPAPSPSGQPSPMPASPAGPPDDSYQHSPLSPAPGGQSLHSQVDATVDAALAHVDQQVDGLHAGTFDGTQLAQANLDDHYGAGHVDTGTDVGSDAGYPGQPTGDTGTNMPHVDPSPAASPMPDPSPHPDPSASPMPAPSPAPADPDGIDDFDTFDKRNEHALDDGGDDPGMGHDDGWGDVV